MKKNTVKYTFRGMNRDVSEGKHPLEFYYEANNIRFLSTSERITGGFAFEKGNDLKISLPDVTINTGTNKIELDGTAALSYTPGNEITEQVTAGELPTSSNAQVIIGHVCTRDQIILFSTDDAGMDCIWSVDMTSYKVSLLYVRNLGFSTENLIQAIYNYENKRIEKMYFIDGVHQVKSLNINHSKENGDNENLIDLDSNILSTVSKVNISQPIIESVVPGGNHTAGKIQYAYNLYRLNAAQTKLSPASELIPLDKGKGKGGGDVNEVVGSTPIVKITNIDTSYTHIKVYAIKYTSYNEIPSVSLIKEEELASRDTITVFDDGHVVAEISLEELLFLGGNPMIPKHIETKDNVLFSANLTEQFFDIELDTRAYSFNPLGNCSVADEVKVSVGDDGLVKTSYEGMYPVYTNTFDTVPDKHNAINPDYNVYKYQSDAVTYGGEGFYLKYRIGPVAAPYIPDVPLDPSSPDNASGIKNPEQHQYFKDGEIYRIGIQFYNRLGQISFPKWIADFKAPEGNLSGYYNTLHIELKSEFYAWLNDSNNFETEDDRPVGYKIIRADRTLNDRTVITQGFLNGMMSNVRSEKGVYDADYQDLADSGNKLPSLTRVFGNHYLQSLGMAHYKTLGNHGDAPYKDEVVTSKARSGMMANTYQYNTIMQLFSPEVTFTNVPLYEGLKLRVRGANKSKDTRFWGQEKYVESQKIVREGKVLAGLTPHDTIPNRNVNVEEIVGDIEDLCDSGIFGPSQRDTDEEDPDTMDFYQFYRGFTGGYIAAPKTVNKNIYGKPEFTEKGQGKTIYNEDPKYTFYNTFEPLMTDAVSYKAKGGLFKDKKMNTPGLNSVNSWGARCLTMVLEGETRLEMLHKFSGLTETNCMLVAEMVKEDHQIYAGNIYGGNTIEARKRSSYIEIGTYQALDRTDTTSNLDITSPGDTFVQAYKFAKITKTDTEVYSGRVNQVTEIVEGFVESSVDLRNRSDISIAPWDARFQPKDVEYHNYNRVYSQQPTLVKNTDTDFTFVKIKDYDVRIIASKLKTPGENIDSWTDVRINETLDLNGRYGAITSLASFKDEIYAFQDNAFSIIGINPRVQTQGNDGIGIELGTGGLLHDYKYISTVSGCVNKWGVIATNNAIYYLDALNKSFQRFSGQGLEGLSSTRGMHTYLVNNLNIDAVRKDNPVLLQGVSLGYDVLNNDVYLTCSNNSDVWTMAFNEKLDQFTGFFSYNAPVYIYTKEKLLTLNPNNTKELYETHAGDYNMFYGTNEKSNIIFIANPEVDHECVFSNLEYKSVALNDNKQEQRYTWEVIRAHNEFQDTGYRSLDMNNIRKLNRKYRLAIPRNQNSTDRIRNNWAFIELSAQNPQGYFYTNQDIVLHYMANYIMIR